LIEFFPLCRWRIYSAAAAGRCAAFAAAPSCSFQRLAIALLVDDTILLPVQVNGKKRGEITIAAGAPAGEVEAAALALDAVKKILAGKPPRKVIIVPGRIVNVVA